MSISTAVSSISSNDSNVTLVQALASTNGGSTAGAVLTIMSQLQDMIKQLYTSIDPNQSSNDSSSSSNSSSGSSTSGMSIMGG